MQRFCTNCGSELKGTEKFCTKCGAATDMNAAGMNVPGVNVGRKTPRFVHGIIIICIVIVLFAGGALAANVITGGMIFGDNRVILKTVNAVKNTENCSFEYLTNFSGAFREDGDSEDVNASFDLNGDISYKDKIGHFKLNITTTDETVPMDMYIQYSDTVMDVYVNIYDEWGKLRIDLSKYQTSLNNIKENSQQLLKDILKETDVEKTELYGTKAYMITAQIDTDEWNKLFTEMYSGALDEMFASSNMAGGISKEEYMNIWSNLPDYSIKLFVDRKTYLPIRLEFDSKDVVTAMLNNVVDLAANHGETGIGFTINSSNSSVNFNGFNQSDITIPQEAYSGYDLGTY